MKFPSAFVKDTDDINVIIETPKGSGNKYAFDPALEMFELSSILPHDVM